VPDRVVAPDAAQNLVCWLHLHGGCMGAGGGGGARISARITARISAAAAVPAAPHWRGPAEAPLHAAEGAAPVEVRQQSRACILQRRRRHCRRRSGCCCLQMLLQQRCAGTLCAAVAPGQAVQHRLCERHRQCVADGRAAAPAAPPRTRGGGVLHSAAGARWRRDACPAGPRLTSAGHCSGPPWPGAAQMPCAQTHPRPPR
jgi:hypothetical protein